MGKITFGGVKSFTQQAVANVVTEVIAAPTILKEVVVEKLVEVIKEVEKPIEVIKYVERIVEVPVQVVVEVIKEIPTETVKYVDKVIEVEKEIVKEVPVYINRLQFRNVLPVWAKIVIAFEAFIIFLMSIK